MRNLTSTGHSTLSEMCRLCLACGATINIFTISVNFGKEIADIITKCAPIQITRNDNMPTSICQLCYIELEKVHHFQTRVVESDRTLQSYLQHRQIESPPEEQSDDPLSQNSATDVTIKCELPEIDDVVDEASNWTDTVPANYNEGNKIIEEVSIKSEIKDEPMDDNLSIPTAEYIDDMTDVNGSENSCEDEEIKIVNPEGVPDYEYSEDEIVNDMNCASPEIHDLEENVDREMLPAKSKDKYELTYATYNSWKSTNKIKQTSEKVLKAYFKIMSKKFKPTTLYTKYSMLKSTIKQKEHKNIKEYKSLILFLKHQSIGYKGKKIKVLSAEEIEKFINEAPDDRYLATKVALIFGVTGACRREELYNVNMNDVETQGDILLIKIPGSNSRVSRSFTITGKFCDIVKKYASLRPPDIPSNRFFVNFQNGKCTKQWIGINKFGGMPKQIATYLGLPDPALYTGHSFRRASATSRVNAGADFTTLQHYSNRKSSTVAQGYVEESISNEEKIGKNMTTPDVSLNPSIKIEELEIPVSEYM